MYHAGVPECFQGILRWFWALSAGEVGNYWWQIEGHNRRKGQCQL